jgi:hypothetical protein
VITIRIVNKFARHTDASALQAVDETAGDPFVNYGRSLSAMQNDTQSAPRGDGSKTQ